MDRGPPRALSWMEREREAGGGRGREGVRGRSGTKDRMTQKNGVGPAYRSGGRGMDVVGLSPSIDEEYLDQSAMTIKGGFTSVAAGHHR